MTLTECWLFSPDSNIVEGQVIQLEDGSSAYVQHIDVPKAGILLCYAANLYIRFTRHDLDFLHLGTGLGCYLFFYIHTR